MVASLLSYEASFIFNLNYHPIVIKLLSFLSCRGIKVTQDLKKSLPPKLKDFREALATGEAPPAVVELREAVEEFSKQFPTIGFSKASMRYKD